MSGKKLHFPDCREPCRCKLREYAGLVAVGQPAVGRTVKREYPVAPLLTKHLEEAGLLVKDRAEHKRRLENARG